MRWRRRKGQEGAREEDQNPPAPLRLGVRALATITPPVVRTDAEAMSTTLGAINRIAGGRSESQDGPFAFSNPAPSLLLASELPSVRSSFPISPPCPHSKSARAYFPNSVGDARENW
jgi:hypothetical protein